MSFANFHPLGSDLLTTLVFLPTLGALVLTLFPGSSKLATKGIALVTSFLTFFVSVRLYRGFDTAIAVPEAFAIDRPWIPQFGIRYQLGLDGFSLALVLLTTILTVSVLLVSCGQEIEKLKGYMVAFLLLETGMLGSLVALDTLLFYVFWEVMLVPMYFIIGIWGGPRKLYAAIKFFLYTLVGSVLMLLSILVLYFRYHEQFGGYSFDITELMRVNLPLHTQIWVFLGFFVGFAIKVPMFPFH